MSDPRTRFLLVERIRARLAPALAAVMVAGGCLPGQAQWLTQTNVLTAGWNAVFLHVDPSHATVDELVANTPEIQEIWYWRPALPTDQFVDSPQRPVDTVSQWSTWTRALGPSSDLKRLVGNGAYLVSASTRVALNWEVKGRPVTPTYRWTLTGLNFLGFPALPTPAPSFASFLAPAPDLLQNAEIYRYVGGNLAPGNPQRVTAFETTPLSRAQAYWIRAGATYNQYFGPVQLVGLNSGAIRFGSTLGQSQLRLRNLAAVPITVTARQLPSEAPPAGQTAIAGAPSLLLRGPLNTTNLTFDYTDLSAAPRQWTLAAGGQVGSEVEVVLGLNRSAMTGDAGALHAGVLRFTDSLGLSQLDVSVSGEKAGTAGLWVGGVAVSYVSHYLKTYAKASNEADLAALLARLQLAESADGYHYELDPGSGRVLVFGGPEHKSGSYLLDGPIKVDSGTVASPFPMRLILHNDGATTRLLQKVFIGIGLGSNVVVATREDQLLPSRLGDGRRISSVHLPVSAGNVPWNCTGSLQRGASLVVTVPLAYDDQSSNPFLHSYHPDHDNLDAQFSTTLSRGAESYSVTRRVTLTFTSPEDNFNSLTQGSQDLMGNYAEVITFDGRAGQSREYNVLGTFTLKRISDIATLTQ